MQMWWNWQTRYFEGVVGVSLCGFKSHRLHQKNRLAVWLSDFFIGSLIPRAAFLSCIYL